MRALNRQWDNEESLSRILRLLSVLGRNAQQSHLGLVGTEEDVVSNNINNDNHGGMLSCNSNSNNKETMMTMITMMKSTGN